jgi:hypothetical protein
MPWRSTPATARGIRNDLGQDTLDETPSTDCGGWILIEVCRDCRIGGQSCLA